MLHVHIQVRHELRFASSVSPTSTRCPDMAVTREPSSILSCTESPWRPPCVYGVPRRIPRRLNTKIPLSIVRGSPRGALHNWATPGGFSPSASLSPRPRWTSLSGFHLPNLEKTLVGGSEGRRLARTGSNGCFCTRPYRSAFEGLRVIEAAYRLSRIASQLLNSITRQIKVTWRIYAIREVL